MLGSFRLFAYLSCILCGSVYLAPLSAESWQVREFLDSLEDSGQDFDFKFVSEGLASISRVKFSDDHTNQFKAFTNVITLNDSMDDGGRRIKRWDHLSNIDLGTLVHESLHAYLENLARVDPELHYIADWFDMRGPNLHKDLSSSKAAVALEEAYAVFIGNMVTNYRFIQSSLKRAKEKMDEDAEYCDRVLKMNRRIWETNWNQEVKGYYYREEIGEYWADQFSYYWDVVRGENPDTIPFEPQYVDESITQADKRWISYVLFEGRLNESAEHSLKNLHEALPCYSPSES